MMRDSEFGVLRLRAFGIFSFRVTDPAAFLKEVFGTNQLFDTESITGQLKRSLVSGLSDLLGETRIPAIELASYYDELSEQAKNRMQPRFSVFGLQLTSLFIENISLPEEVEKVLDKKTSMGILGNMQQYAQYQTAEAIRDAAKNESGGFAAVGAGFGAGTAIGNMMGEAIKTMGQKPQEVQSVSEIKCPNCGALVPSGYKFCGVCGKPVGIPKVKCTKCSKEIDPGLKFCPECGSAQDVDKFCKNCGNKIEEDSKFCPKCGTRTE
jgi:membrane protease subunit (stomatin/prohibitin family)